MPLHSKVWFASIELHPIDWMMSAPRIGTPSEGARNYLSIHPFASVAQISHS